MKIGYLVAPNSTAAEVLRKRLMNHGAEKVIVDIGTNVQAAACLDSLTSGDSLYVWNIFHLCKNSQGLRDILQRLMDNNIMFFVSGDRVNFSLPHVLPEIYEIIDEHEETMRTIKPRLEYFEKIVQEERVSNPFGEPFQQSGTTLSAYAEYFRLLEDQPEKVHNPFKELRQQSGMMLNEYAKYFSIPERLLELWEEGTRSCPPYLLELMQYKLKNENIIK